MQVKKTMRGIAALAMAAAFVMAPASQLGTGISVSAAEDTAVTETKELKSADLDAYYYYDYYYPYSYYYDYYNYYNYYYDYYYPYYYSSYYYPSSYYYYHDYYYYPSSYYYNYYDPYYSIYSYNSYPYIYTGYSSISYKTVNATASAYKNSITVSWDSIKNAKSYSVYVYKDGEYKKVKTTTDTSVTFDNLKNGETYKFLVRYTAKNGSLSPSKYSAFVSAEVNCKPVVKSSTSFNGISLSWNRVSGATDYAVYKVVNGKLRKLGETDKTSVRLTGLVPGEIYSYVVRALVDGEWTTATESDIVTVIAM